jgi:hypothetical protein
MPGPLRRNDLFGWYPGNPVRVTENHTRVITLELVRLSDMPDDVSPRDASDRAVGGVVRDAAGKAISGMRVLAHDNEALSGKPAAGGGETGPGSNVRRGDHTGWWLGGGPADPRKRVSSTGAWRAGGKAGSLVRVTGRPPGTWSSW